MKRTSTTSLDLPRNCLPMATRCAPSDSHRFEERKNRRLSSSHRRWTFGGQKLWNQKSYGLEVESALQMRHRRREIILYLRLKTKSAPCPRYGFHLGCFRTS